MCVCVRAHVDVRMHSCRRILFICTVQSLYYMRVYHRCFLTLACMCVGGLEVGFVSACSWLALVSDVGGCVLSDVEIGVLSCIFLYFCGCLYTRVHTHKLLGYLMWAQVWDGHLESWKNPDRLKRSIHVDCIGVHSTFVYVYAGLRALMIWANYLFSFNMSFLLRKVEDVTTISKSQSLTLVSIQDYTSRVPNETTTLFLLRVIIKAIFIQKIRPAAHFFW